MKTRLSVPHLILMALAALAAPLPTVAGTPEQATATADATPESTEARVTRRAEERWALLTEGRLESAYEYLSPGYRAAHTLRDYVRSIASTGMWEGARVRDMACEGPRCQVNLVLDLNLNPGGRIQTLIKESWIQAGEDGEWWFVPKR